jgi:hypothetical protein
MMLRKFTAVWLATAMIAGAAYAAEPSATPGSTTPPAAVSANAKTAAAPTTPTKHLRKHARRTTHRHFVHRNVHGMKTAHHLKNGKSHKAHLARVGKVAKHAKHGNVKTAKLPATRTN